MTRMEEFQNILKKYPIIDDLLCSHIFWLKFNDENNIIDIGEACDYYYETTLNSEECKELSDCFLELSRFLKKQENNNDN